VRCGVIRALAQSEGSCEQQAFTWLAGSNARIAQRLSRYRRGLLTATRGAVPAAEDGRRVDA
jgi:hypothetical protein